MVTIAPAEVPTMAEDDLARKSRRVSETEKAAAEPRRSVVPRMRAVLKRMVLGLFSLMVVVDEEDIIVMRHARSCDISAGVPIYLVDDRYST